MEDKLDSVETQITTASNAAETKKKENDAKLLKDLDGLYEKFNSLPVFDKPFDKVVKEDNKRTVEEDKLVWIVAQLVAFFI